MTIEIKRTGTAVTIAVGGKLNTDTAPELCDAVQENIDGVTKLSFDFTDLDYMSSAGLRVLLNTQKMINQQSGEMEILHPTEAVRDVLAMTGMLDILTVIQ